MNRSSTHAKRRWSPAEKWILAGCGVILLSVGWPTCSGWAIRRRQAMVRRDLVAVQVAAERYFADYGRWPSPHMGTRGDMRYGWEADNDLVLNILRAIDGPGNEGHRLNPDRIVYFNPPSRRRGRSGVGADGQWRDPWGAPYQLVLDTDLDNMCTMAQTRYPNQYGTGIVVWSFGPDRQPDTTQDLGSWQLN